MCKTIYIYSIHETRFWKKSKFKQNVSIVFLTHLRNNRRISSRIRSQLYIYVLIADSFYVSGGRYGRSESGVEKASKSQLAKLVEAEVPRIDRFVWGGRYDDRKRSPPDYRPVSSVNRFSAVLDFMDQVDLDREKNDLTENRNELDFLP